MAGGAILPLHPAMNIDSDRGIDVLMDQAVRVNGNPRTYYCAVERGGFPESGGASTSPQEGEQYVIRCRYVDYKIPAVHDKLYTKDFGTLEVKQFFKEGDFWAIRATGKVAGRMEIV